VSRFNSGQRVYCTLSDKPPFQVGTLKHKVSGPLHWQPNTWLVDWDAMPGVMRRTDGFCAEVDLAPWKGGK
jgi:hypothetical protein